MNQRLYQFLHRRAGWLLLVFGFLALIASPLVLRRGMLHPEDYHFLPSHLSERPWLVRVLDVNGADWGLYQGRELSYVFDNLDCQVIAWGVDHGWPHFLSITHYMFMAATVGLMWWFARRHARLPALGAALLCALFVTTPAVFLGGSYFHTAKQGVTLCLLIVACAVAPAFDRDGKLAWYRGLLVLLAGTAMALFDRQGLFLLLLLALLLALRARSITGWLWCGLVLLAAALAEIYNRAIGPALIERVNGYRPNFDFQSLPLGQIFQSRETFVDLLTYAPQLALDNLRFLVGDVPIFVAALALIAGIVWLAPKLGHPSERTRLQLSAALVPLALIGMNALMILRLKAMVGLDFRRIYYGLPSIAAFWIVAAIALAALCRTTVRRRWWWSALAVLLACNLGALSEHRHIIRAGLYRDYYRVSPDLLNALTHLDTLPHPDSVPPLTFASQPEGSPIERDGIVRFFQERQRRLKSAP